MSKALHAYINKYSEPSTHDIQTLPPFFKKYVCVIPCYDETIDFIHGLTQHQDTHNTVIILVVNQPYSQPFAQNINNHTLVTHLKQNGQVHWQHQNTHFITYKKSTFIVVEHTQKNTALPVKQGVGLARKIGADIAVSLISKHYVSTPIIFSTDADASLPSTYFNQTIYNTKVSAWVFDYTHTKDNSEISVATHYYEQAIKYYKEALAWAGSPYGFHTLGSTLAVNALSYCAVRGFPKRSAGEDFYLLNKLAKVGKIQSLDSTILLKARISNRVPFGTGPAAQHIINDNINLDNTNLNSIETLNYTYYAPDCFKALKDTLNFVPLLLSFYQKNNHLETSLNNTFKQSTYCAAIIDALNALNIQKFLTHCIKQRCTQVQFMMQFFTWFDAFITLKFIRYMTEHTYPQKPLAFCLRHAPYIN